MKIRGGAADEDKDDEGKWLQEEREIEDDADGR